MSIPHNNHKVIAITVSTNYDDILGIIMPRNAQFFTKWIIVTREDDLATHEVIRKYNYPNVEIMYFDFTAGGNKFNKGGAIRYAQQQIPVEYTGLVLILDSDILLPTNFGEIITKTKFRQHALYSVSTRKDFHSYMHLKNNIVDFEYPKKYIFAGFFQLYKHSPKLLYKSSHNCSKCDLEFILLFNYRKKTIYGLHVKHLGMDGVNWDGRITNTKFIEDCPVKNEDIACI